MIRESIAPPPRRACGAADATSGDDGGDGPMRTRATRMLPLARGGDDDGACSSSRRSAATTAATVLCRMGHLTAASGMRSACRARRPQPRTGSAG